MRCLVAAVAGSTQQDLWLWLGLGNEVGPRPIVAAVYLATSVALYWRRRAAVAVLAFVFTAGAAQYLAFGAPEALGTFLRH